MPRIRTIKPQFWGDEDLARAPREARLLFIGIWNLCDDYGICKRHPAWLKGQLFPYDDDLKIDQIEAWIEALIREKCLFSFQIDLERFIAVRNFSTHQHVMRPSFHGFISPKKFSKYLNLSTIPQTFDEYSMNTHLLLNVVSSKSNSNSRRVSSKEDTLGNGTVTGEKKNSLKNQYDLLEKKDKVEIINFVTKNKPDFIDPYFDLWNIFAAERKLPKLLQVTQARKRLLSVRIREERFNFLEILSKAAKSDFILKSNFFCFDWIIHSEANYLKVIEGNYTNKENTLNGHEQPSKHDAAKLSAALDKIAAKSK